MEQQATLTFAHGLSDGGRTAFILSCVFSFLSSIAVGLRFYVRKLKNVRVLVEDWLLLAALVCPDNGLNTRFPTSTMAANISTRYFNGVM